MVVVEDVVVVGMVVVVVGLVVVVEVVGRVVVVEVVRQLHEGSHVPGVTRQEEL